MASCLRLLNKQMKFEITVAPSQLDLAIASIQAVAATHGVKPLQRELSELSVLRKNITQYNGSFIPQGSWIVRIV